MVLFQNGQSDDNSGTVRTRILLSLLATITVLFVLIAQPARVHGKTTPDNEELSRDIIVQLTNAERENAGLTKLAENPVLDYIAEARAKEIIETQSPSHMSPSGQQVSHVARRFGYPYRFLAENLASGTFGSNGNLVTCWMQSPAHRKNILSTRIREIGVSVIKGKINGKDMWVSVQVFGSRMGGPLYSLSNGTSPSAHNAVSFRSSHFHIRKG